MPYQVTYDVVATPILPYKCLSRGKDASILSWPRIMGHLRRCSDADTTNKCLSRGKDASILSWPTIMGHLKQLIVVFTA
eukprot:scaffold2757_cov105-Skeletonema_marinoi.AAC.1